MENQRSHYSLFGEKVYRAPSTPKRLFRVKRYEMNEYMLFVYFVVMIGLLDAVLGK